MMLCFFCKVPHSLAKEVVKVLAPVHLFQMLLEVIKSRPHLFVPRATISEAFVVLTLAMLWHNMVNTLLMSLEVIDVWEARLPWTTRNSTYMLFLVPSHMFSSAKINAVQ
jgi:hypothetical protein